MKILLVTGIFPPDYGGPASYVPAIAVGLAQGNEIVSVITLSDNLSYDDSGYPFPVVRLPRQQSRFFRTVRTVATIRKLSKKADVIYLNGLVFEGIVACKLLGRKRVVIKVVGDLIWERARNAGVTQDSLDEFQKQSSYGLKVGLLKKLQGWYTARADAIITPSRYLSGIVSGWGVPPGRINVVYNSLLVRPPSEKNDEGKTFDCVTVARLVPWKGVAELIDIAVRCGWSLNIVGDGPERTKLMRQVADKGGCELVRFAGHVAKDQVAREIAKAKVFILNSTYEGLPHIILEAKGVGVPVIATAVGGTPETINDGVNGLLVSPNNNDELTDRIFYLLERPEERVRLSEAGLRQIEERFSFQTMLTETEIVLHDICSGEGVSVLQ